MKDDKAFPNNTSTSFYQPGMDLRDYFAANESGTELSRGMIGSTAAEIMGVERIPENNLENLEFWMKLEAKLQYMKADAMMEARKL